MQAVKEVTGRAVPLDRADVDTDQIIPAAWLKRVERTGFGEGLFEAWRKDPNFVLNDARYSGPILLAGPNFGCGSSREHAPWALEDYGFKAIIAPSFADIFRNNCLKIGLLPVTISEMGFRFLVDTVRDNPDTEITIDVQERTVTCENADLTEEFELDDFTQHRLLNGLDDIGITLQHADDIDTYESQRPNWLPITA